MPTIARIPFAVMLAIIVALVLAIDVVGALEHWGDRTLYLLVIPAGLAAWFLVEYRKLPYDVPGSAIAASTTPNTGGDPSDAGSLPPASGEGGSLSPNGPGGSLAEADFDDPVVEADRIESETHREPPREPSAPDTEPDPDEPS
jgi:hypothetical protein